MDPLINFPSIQTEILFRVRGAYCLMITSMTTSCKIVLVLSMLLRTAYASSCSTLFSRSRNLRWVSNFEKGELFQSYNIWASRGIMLLQIIRCPFRFLCQPFSSFCYFCARPLQTSLSCRHFLANSGSFSLSVSLTLSMSLCLCYFVSVETTWQLIFIVTILCSFWQYAAASSQQQSQHEAENLAAKRTLRPVSTVCPATLGPSPFPSVNRA